MCASAGRALLPPHPRLLCPCVLGGTTPQQSLVGTRSVREEVPGADAARQDFPEGSVWDLVGGGALLGSRGAQRLVGGLSRHSSSLEGNPALWLLSLPCLPSPGSSCGHVCCRFFCFSIPGTFFWNDREGRIQAFRMPLCGHTAGCRGAEVSRGIWCPHVLLCPSPPLLRKQNSLLLEPCIMAACVAEPQCHGSVSLSGTRCPVSLLAGALSLSFPGQSSQTGDLP